MQHLKAKAAPVQTDTVEVRTASKIRKIDSECRVFNPKWKSKYFVTHIKGKMFDHTFS